MQLITDACALAFDHSQQPWQLGCGQRGCVGLPYHLLHSHLVDGCVPAAHLLRASSCIAVHGTQHVSDERRVISSPSVPVGIDKGCVSPFCDRGAGCSTRPCSIMSFGFCIARPVPSSCEYGEQRRTVVNLVGPRSQSITVNGIADAIS